MWRFTLLVVIFLFFTTPAEAAFTRTLFLGMSGSDVRELQVLLNQDVETRIALSGPGSPGLETAYFGPLTERAVIKYQEKYRSTILVPLNLSRGTGYVGPSTLAHLSETPAQSTVATPPAVPAPVAPEPEVAKLAQAGNPNVSRLSYTLEVIDTVGKAQGYTSDALARAKEAATRQIVSTSTDLRAALISEVLRSSPGVKPLTFGDQLRTLARDFAMLFTPHAARAIATINTLPGGGTPFDDPTLGGSGIVGFGGAASVGVPFGGAIDGSPVWCLCTASWWIPITPLPPTMPTALSYVPGTQAYLTYNIPATIWMLGFYEPGVQCLIYDGDSCIPLPTQGLITPIVGSSGL